MSPQLLFDDLPKIVTDTTTATSATTTTVTQVITSTDVLTAQ